jgi:hypothetical protein
MSDPYVDREFMIFNVSELNKINFNEVLETSIDTVGLTQIHQWVEFNFFCNR